MSFKCQSSMSPDLNVLDLCFFNLLQTLQLCKLATTFEELRDNVLTSFREYETTKLSDIWITLQLIYNEVIKHKGTKPIRIDFPISTRRNSENKADFLRKLVLT